MIFRASAWKRTDRFARKQIRRRDQAQVRGIRAFSLIELLVVITIVAVLAALLLAAYNRSVQSALAAKCAGRLRALGAATITYTADHDGDFPRSWHSAGANRQPNWSYAIAPYLGFSQEEIESNWESIFNTHFRCPAHQENDPYTYSYAMNVHFELDPDGDDYLGAPASWRKVFSVPRPGRTVLLAETKGGSYGDHFMCHQWSGASAAENALHHDIHNGKSNFLFVDGHVELLSIEEAFSGRDRNLFNPGLAK